MAGWGRGGGGCFQLGMGFNRVQNKGQWAIIEFDTHLEENVSSFCDVISSKCL